ncbi:hypothetical protein ACLOJK_032984 [Asimina triloba]
MRLSFSSSCCSRLQSSIRPKPRRATTGSRHNDPLLLIMGATGTGKSQLSIDIATTPGLPTSEIINADKIQLYRGLDVTTNKIPLHERSHVPHHLLGDFDPSHGEISALRYRSIAASAATEILARAHLPIVVGGSNSFLQALVADRYVPSNHSSGFGIVGPNPTQFRYDCCFIWVDVSLPVLFQHLLSRVDRMLEKGMFEELARFFGSGGPAGDGLGQAIGVPEFGRYFGLFGGSRPEGDSVRAAAFEEAVRRIKENTCRLAERQMGKIQRLRLDGWDLRRVDATEAVLAAMRGNAGCVRFREAWEMDVLGPSLEVVKAFVKGRF